MGGRAHASTRWCEALGPDGAGVPCSPVYTVDQLLTHPQLLAREMIQRLPHPTLGEVVAPGVVVKMSDTPGAAADASVRSSASTPPRCYRELLGLSDEELAALRARQVI